MKAIFLFYRDSLQPTPLESVELKAIFLFYRDSLQPTPLGVGLTNRKRFDLYLAKLNSTVSLGVGLTNRKKFGLYLTKLNSTISKNKGIRYILDG